MKQVINILLELTPQIKALKKKYDPYSSKFLPHMTLVFPFEYEYQEKLKVHIKKSLEKISPFDISFEEIGESYPFIQFRAKEGKVEFLELRKMLNSNILKETGEKGPLRHPPHMTIGVVKDKKEFDNVVKELKKNNPKFKTRINKITLMDLNKDMSMKSKKEFKLK